MSAAPTRPGPPAAMSGRALALLLALALAARLVPVFAAPFLVRPDEVFQVLEPAHRLLTGRGAVTWEWREGIRSWLPPAAVAPVLWASAALGLGHAMAAVEVVLAVASLAAVAVAVRFGEAAAGPAGGLFCGLLLGFWPDPVLLGPHSLTEVQGGALLATGTLLAERALARPRIRPAPAAGIGALLGLAAIVRFQLAPGLLPVLGLALLRRRRGGFGALAGAVAAMVALQAGLDAATLGSPLQSVWKNLAVNLGQDAASAYGRMPAVFYPVRLGELWGAALLPLAACVAAGARRAKLSTAVAATVVATHSLIGHKEYSFVYGAVLLLLAVAGIGAARLVDRLGKRLGGRDRVARRAAAAILAAALLATISGYRTMREDRRGFLEAARAAHALPGICGEGQYVTEGEWWAWAGGYTVLDRGVPLFLPRDPAGLARATPGFDALIAEEAMLPTLPAGWRRVRCAARVCLLRRNGPCLPVATDRIEDAPMLGRLPPPGR